MRLGSTIDGFNPFDNMSISYSTWPVLLFLYNLSPWMCMKKPYLFVTLLIPSPKGPDNDIDVYIELLIEELKGLWENEICTYDASLKENLNIRVALL